MDGGARFLPVAAPLPLFRLFALVGARALASTASPVGGTGVAFDSDDFSLGSVGGTGGEGSTLSGDAEGFVVTTSDGKCES